MTILDRLMIIDWSAAYELIMMCSSCCYSLCKYLTVASGRASVFVLRARPTTQIKVHCLLAISLVLHDTLNNLLT